MHAAHTLSHHAGSHSNCRLTPYSSAPPSTTHTHVHIGLSRRRDDHTAPRHSTSPTGWLHCQDAQVCMLLTLHAIVRYVLTEYCGCFGPPQPAHCTTDWHRIKYNMPASTQFSQHSNGPHTDPLNASQAIHGHNKYMAAVETMKVKDLLAQAHTTLAADQMNYVVPTSGISKPPPGNCAINASAGTQQYTIKCLGAMVHTIMCHGAALCTCQAQ
jgi:hypothetical protein